MFELLRTHLQTKSIVLASASPRRRELLAQIGIQFKVIPSTFEENLSKEKSAQEYAELTALHKARQVYSSLCLDTQDPPDIVIGADTVVEHQGLILEKPDDAAHAKEMLQGLSGSRHRVHTGVAIVQSDREISFCETTTVCFMKFSDADIDEYIASGEPFGKAGAYGIQGKAAVFVESIQGCFYNGMWYISSSFVLDIPCAHLIFFLLRSCWVALASSPARDRKKHHSLVSKRRRLTDHDIEVPESHPMTCKKCINK